MDNNKHGEHMNHSSTYSALEDMIKKSWVTGDIAEFNQVLDRYVQESRITAEEHQSLLKLYVKNVSYSS